MFAVSSLLRPSVPPMAISAKLSQSRTIDTETEMTPQMCQQRMSQVPFETMDFSGSVVRVVSWSGVYVVSVTTYCGQYRFGWSELRFSWSTLPLSD